MRTGSLAVAALALGIVGLFSAGGLVAGSLLGLALAGFSLTRSRAGRDVAWAAVAANVVALVTVIPVGAAVLAYRATPLVFESDDSLPEPAQQSSFVAPLEEPPPPPPPAPPQTPAQSAAGLTPSPRQARRETLAAAAIRVGGEIQEPRKLRHVNPVYPREAVAARLQGVVVLECTISPTGKVVEVKKLKGDSPLSEAAIAAVRQWEYTPTVLNGVPVPVIMTVTVNFKLS